MNQVTKEDTSRIPILASEFAERMLSLFGNKPFRFREPFLFRDVYDHCGLRTLLRTGRQLGKTTTLANIMTFWSSIIPYFRTQFVSASKKQRNRFSREALGSALKSPHMIKYLMSDNKNVNNIGYKQLDNGSIINLSYASVTGDRIRGNVADACFADEIQDIATDAIDVIEQTMTTSPFKFRIYSGTPKTLDSSIEKKWRESKQIEWTIICDKCNGINHLDEKNISQYGLICRYSKCRRPLDTRRGQWVINNENGLYLGYRIPQIAFPEPHIDWEQSIWIPYNSYGPQKFFNEVLALPYDIGVKPITEADIRKCCNSELRIYDELPDRIRNRHSIMGIDWGTGDKSFTVAVLIVLMGQKYKVVWAKKFRGMKADSEVQKELLANYCTKLEPNIVVADWGFGFGQNGALNKMIPQDLIEVESVSSKTEVKWDKEAQRYMMDKTKSLSETFEAIKEEKFEFPRWSEFSIFAEDILAEYMEEASRRLARNRFYYDHNPEVPDDFLHALNVAYLYARLLIGQTNILGKWDF